MTRILVVDDEPDIVAILARMLRGMGYEMISAHNGKDALDKIKRDRPDLITLDIMMPDMDGFETLVRIRGDEENASIPVVMVSVKDDQSDIVKALELGANDYITKPYNKTILLAKVRSLLKLKRMEDRIKHHSEDMESLVDEKTQEAISVGRELKEIHERLNVQYGIQEKELNLANLQLEEDRIKVKFIAGLSGISSLTLFLALIILMRTGDMDHILWLLIFGTVIASFHILLTQKKIGEAQETIARLRR